MKESDQILDLLVGNHSADKENVRPRVVELIGHETVGTPIEVREARNDRQRKHREKLRVKTRELREHLAAGKAAASTGTATSAPKVAAK